MTNVKVGQINYFNNQPLKKQWGKSIIRAVSRGNIRQVLQCGEEVIHWHRAWTVFFFFLSLSAPMTDDKKRKWDNAFRSHSHHGLVVIHQKVPKYFITLPLRSDVKYLLWDLKSIFQWFNDTFAFSWFYDVS